MAIPAVAEEKTEITGLSKAAIVLLVIGEEASAEILRHLDEDEVHSFGVKSPSCL